MTDSTEVTRTLARYVVDAKYDDIPGDVRHEAKRALLNWLGCAIGTAHHETVECALTALAPFAGAPQAAVLGRSERLDILNAAFLNGVSSHVLDFDDTHEKAIPPSAPVYPALLALGEWQFGAGKGTRSLVVLALGTGVGGGIILDGRLHRGHGGFGGELGHVPINFDGRPCICGGRGCLKAYVSGTDIALVGTERLERAVTAAEVFRLAANGDPIARDIVDQVCEALGAGLAVIVNGLNPECLLLAGSVAKSLKPLEKEVRARVERYAFARALATTRIEILSLDKDATVRGGAALVQYETRRRSGAAR